MLFSQDIGIDLGTANTLVCVRNKGIVIREPSVVAVDVKANPVKVVAVGEEAKQMIGRTPGSITTLRPLKEGVIANFEMTADMLREFIKKAMRGSPFSRARVMICIPSGVTEVERRAVHDAAKSAGARYVSLIEEPMAAAIGAGLPVAEAVGSMIADIGGGTAEVAVIALGDIVTANSAKVAGDSFDDAIVQYIKRKYNLLIGERTAEEIKISIGSAAPYEGEGAMDIKGRNLVDGLPKNVEITSEDIREALSDPVNQIVETIRLTLEKTPPELASDIMDSGITLTGGGALLRGIDKLIADATGMPVHIAENPLDCVVTGTAICLEKDNLNIGRRLK
ncbi:MAG: rod shape-determining protein [Clostridia bacterium]|nr:rod shape-determining protein [Clostridia bacterium]MBR3975001.1 rod shape-determining protein [Clostridia bacterium]